MKFPLLALIISLALISDTVEGHRRRNGRRGGRRGGRRLRPLGLLGGYGVGLGLGGYGMGLGMGGMIPPMIGGIPPMMGGMMGGVPPVVGGAGPVNGVVQPVNGNNQQTNGNVQQTNGNVQQTNGNVQQTNGGFQQTNGGFQQANGGFQQTNGGFQQTNGGFQQTNGFQQANGFQSMGKRSMENVTVSNSTKTMCELTTLTSKISCTGEYHTFECDVEKRFNMTHLEHELKDLRILSADFGKDKNATLEKTFLLSLNPEEVAFNNYTMKHNETEILMSIFHSKDMNDTGFRVKDLACWERFEKMMDHDEQVRLSLTMKF